MITIETPLKQRPESPRLTGGERPSIVRSFVIRVTGGLVSGEEMGKEVQAAFEAELPDTDGSLVLTDTQVESIAGNDQFWFGEAAYADPAFSPPDVGSMSLTFDTTGGREHVNFSLATIDSHFDSPLSDAPDFQQAINVTDGRVNGVDIIVPSYAWQETHTLAQATVTSQYKKNVRRLTGRVNNAPFREWEAGEVLFMGARGALRQQAGAVANWELTFSFASRLNEENISIGGMSGIDKLGWDYLWVHFANAPDSNGQQVTVHKPIGAYVERVYPIDDFADLGIGN